jgi:hypothetical protein
MPPSFLIKLDRAREHLDSLDNKVKTWVNSKPYDIVDEPDPETPPNPLDQWCSARRFRISRVSDVPPGFSVLIGDFLFNLRASLDHLALALAIAFSAKSGSGMTAKQIEGSEFPIFHARAMKPEEELKKIGCIDPQARTEIIGLQPYHAGNRYATDPLWQIHELNRIDKHRALHVVAVQSSLNGQPVVGFFPDGNKNFGGYCYVETPKRFYLELDAVFFRYGARPIDPSLDVSMQPTISPEIAFGQSGPLVGEIVVPTLGKLYNHVVGVVIPALEKFL